MYERTLADFERRRGTTHPTALLSRNNLASGYLWGSGTRPPALTWASTRPARIRG
jgi:hypothetical protein